MSRSEEDGALDAEDEEERTSSTIANEDVAPMFGSLLSSADTPLDTRTVLTEDWWHIVRKWYPDMLHKVYCVPPVHFYAISYKERDPHPELQEPCERFGMRMFLPMQYSNVRDDEAQQRVLSTLLMFLKARGSVAFVLSNVEFQNYLNKSYELGPGVSDLPRPMQGDEGKIDIIVIDKRHGIFALEVKATGYRHEITSAEKCADCLTAIRKVTKQLSRGATVLRRILADLDPDEQIKIRTGVLMPNLDKAVLQMTLEEDPKHQEEFVAAVGAKRIEEAVNCCLCSEGFPSARTDIADAVNKRAILENIGHFWNTLQELTGHMDMPIEDAVYEQLVARFCGHLSTVKVYTEKSMPGVKLRTGPARKKDPRRRSKRGRPEKVLVEPFEVRTLAGAAREVARRFSELVLLPEQTDLLKSEEDFMHLEGPPGTGKMLMLLQRVLTWLGGNNMVWMLSLSPSSRSITRVLYEQVKEMLFLHKQRESVEILKRLRIFIMTRPERTLNAKYFEWRLHKWRLGAKLRDSRNNCDNPRPPTLPPVAPLTHKKVCLVLVETGISGKGLKAFFDQVAVCHREKCFTSEEAGFIAGLSVWSASGEKCGRPYYVRDPTTEPYSEEKFGVYRHLKMPLRCPPSVQRALMLVQPALDENNVFLFQKDHLLPNPARSADPYSKCFQYPADGLPVFLIGHGGHKKADKPVWLCRQCGEELANFLKDRLRIGEDEHVVSDISLQYRDVLIVGTHGAFKSVVTGGFFAAMCKKGLRMGISKPSEEGGVALSAKDVILVTGMESSHGLERAVVVMVPQVLTALPQQQQELQLQQQHHHHHQLKQQQEMGKTPQDKSDRLNISDKAQGNTQGACTSRKEVTGFEAEHACAAENVMESENQSALFDALQIRHPKLGQERRVRVSEEENRVQKLESDIPVHRKSGTSSEPSQGTTAAGSSSHKTRRERSQASWHTRKTLSDSKEGLSDSQQKASGSQLAHGPAMSQEHFAYAGGAVPKRKKLDDSFVTDTRPEPGPSARHETGEQHPLGKKKEERKRDVGPFYTEPPSEREIQAALSTLSEQDQRDLFYIGSRAVCQLVIIHFGN